MFASLIQPCFLFFGGGGEMLDIYVGHSCHLNSARMARQYCTSWQLLDPGRERRDATLERTAKLYGCTDLLT